MSINLWIVLGWFALNLLTTIAYVGKPREPIAPSTAVVSVFIYAALAWLVVTA